MAIAGYLALRDDRKVVVTPSPPPVATGTARPDTPPAPTAAAAPVAGPVLSAPAAIAPPEPANPESTGHGWMLILAALAGATILYGLKAAGIPLHGALWSVNRSADLARSVLTRGRMLLSIFGVVGYAAAGLWLLENAAATTRVISLAAGFVLGDKYNWGLIAVGCLGAFILVKLIWHGSAVIKAVTDGVRPPPPRSKAKSAREEWDGAWEDADKVSERMRKDR